MKAWILDTETTGLVDPHMTELAYSIIYIDENGIRVIQEPRSKRFNPCKPIALGSMATSHITDEDVANEPPHTDFKLPASVGYLVGHNIDFDMQVLRNAGITHAPKLICTQAMAQRLLPELDSHKLVALLYYFHHDYAHKYAKKAHAAVWDIEFTAIVLQSLIKLANSNGENIVDMESLYQFSEIARIPLYMPFKKYKGKTITDLAIEDPKYLQWVVNNVTNNDYLVKACQQALLNKGEPK
ncbi:3'-5' exonuclease [Psychrobacter sp. I-STPA10]|uniref:3'-5' exonuclease n=1 Tax=Psychrobacter sp. I-STPA10 TaxID=2585769 RepID=UPI001E4942D1|nr:3'-5' exonuclease [Psychrobacter sp. I-STPA10]